VGTLRAHPNIPYVKIFLLVPGISFRCNTLCIIYCAIAHESKSLAEFENEQLIHYWVTSDTKEPKQAEFLDHKGHLWSITFVEVNVAPQSQHLFKLPEALEGKCNTISY